VTQTAPATVQNPARDARALFGAIAEASKPRITRLVTITAGVGFVLAAVTRRWEIGELAMTAVGALAGTALSAAGANALNQWMERDRDALMPRTCDRPLPQKRLTPREALAAGAILATAGIGILWALCGVVPALVSLTTVLVYLLAYTPLKPVTPLATLVGAIPGALPPLIGWTAAAGNGPASLLGAGGLMLFGIMFIWQVPHFLAIAWMYRDDYRAGGYKVLPVVDVDGRRTARSILAWSVALLPATIAPVVLMRGAAGVVYAVLAGIMGVGYVYLAWRVVAGRERRDARRAFLASVIHLPLLMMLMVACVVISRVL
jgi:protoheme IX farnesyltransferase